MQSNKTGCCSVGNSHVKSWFILTSILPYKKRRIYIFLLLQNHIIKHIWQSSPLFNISNVIFEYDIWNALPIYRITPLQIFFFQICPVSFIRIFEAFKSFANTFSSISLRKWIFANSTFKKVFQVFFMWMKKMNAKHRYKRWKCNQLLSM